MLKKLQREGTASRGTGQGFLEEVNRCSLQETKGLEDGEGGIVGTLDVHVSVCILLVSVCGACECVWVLSFVWMCS